MMKFSLPCLLVLMSCMSTASLAQSTGRSASDQNALRSGFGPSTPMRQQTRRGSNRTEFTTLIPLDPLLGAPSIGAPESIDGSKISSLDPLLGAPSDYLDSNASAAGSASGMAPSFRESLIQQGNSVRTAGDYAPTPTERMMLLQGVVDREKAGQAGNGFPTLTAAEERKKSQYRDHTTQSIVGTNASSVGISSITSGAVYSDDHTAATAKQIYRSPW
ncbi:hypothetical protein DM39_6251 [Burkholderia cenocepacia]|uniref:Uncharacterized protein n=1 Tax=Burkholderia cenocepacia TaxID=95486 RepID=A0AAN0RML1_9BURK|nr:hypothetical protein DM39_6251 [Burkholderia cenocepacia]